jgi:predicted GIY-YIG superfamily endonuclease
MFLYKIDIPKTGKSYIGQTTKSVDQRFKEHCDSKNNSLISKAIRLHGGATYMTLYTASSKEELNRFELDAIRRFKTGWPDGYNLVTGPDEGVAIPEEVRPKKQNGSSGGPRSVKLKTEGNIEYWTQGEKKKNTRLKHTNQLRMKGSLRYGVKSQLAGTYYLSGCGDWHAYLVNILGPHNNMSKHIVPVKQWRVTKETYDMVLNRVLSEFNN